MMKMPKQLQMRELKSSEKVLLGSLAIILVVLSSYQFVITPQERKLEDFNRQKIEYQDKINENGNLISRENQIDADLLILDEEKELLASKYFPKLDQAQAIYLLNSLLIDDEIEVSDMDFDRPSFEEVGDLQMKHMDISVPFEGTYSAIINLINNLNNSPRHILINSVNMDRDSNNTLTGNISVRIYGLDEMTDSDKDAVIIPVEEREIEDATPFTAYSGYVEKDNNQGQSIGEQGQGVGSGNTGSTGEDANEGALQEINPYSPEYSIDYEKDNESSALSEGEFKK